MIVIGLVGYLLLRLMIVHELIIYDQPLYYRWSSYIFI